MWQLLAVQVMSGTVNLGGGPSRERREGDDLDVAIRWTGELEYKLGGCEDLTGEAKREQKQAREVVGGARELDVAWKREIREMGSETLSNSS